MNHKSEKITSESFSSTFSRNDSIPTVKSQSLFQLFVTHNQLADVFIYFGLCNTFYNNLIILNELENF